ncbi:hypothetical protein IWQ61_001054 [Dispira simplex]|nr:hypothetical protein IWQ61_001054 [Dispira simplex]
MSRDNKSYKIGDTIPSRQENPKQYGLDNPRLARRGRGNKCRRRRSSSAAPSPDPSPSRICGSPITGATDFSQEHMDALHVVPVLNCPMEEVVPLNHCPDDLFHRIRAFWALDREDLYNRNYDLLTTAIAEAADVHNRSLTARIDLGLLACMEAMMSLVEHYIRADLFECDSNFDDDESKIVTTNCMDILCNKFLLNFTQLCGQKYPTWDYCPVSWDTQVLSERYNFTVRPDRVILHAQSKRQRTPFAWVTINPDYLAPTSEEYESIFPQIAAQTIAMVRHQPHEVFGLEFSHHYVTFWRALIPENYLELVKVSGGLPPDMILKMKRSTVLDLELLDGRREFSRAFLSLLMYWNKQVKLSE